MEAHFHFKRISPDDLPYSEADTNVLGSLIASAPKFEITYALSSGDDEMPARTYSCPYNTMTYLISTPVGRTYSLSLIDEHPVPGYEAAKWKQQDYKVFDSQGAWPGFSEEGHIKRRFYWKQEDVPAFTAPGEYRVVETGVFRDTAGKLPDLPYRSTDAAFVVDPSILSVQTLMARATEILLTDFKLPRGRRPDGRPDTWSVREVSSGNRVLETMILFPTNLSKNEQLRRGLRFKREWPGAQKWVLYTLEFTPDGQLVRQERKPEYWVY